MFNKLLLLMIALLGAAPGLAAEIRLSAAASMNDALKEIAASYAGRRPEAIILPNFASSGALAKQIAQGAPADIFVSANPKWMDYLVAEQRIAPEKVETLACNSLVLVGNPNLKISSLDDLLALPRLALGSPKSVPAGQYAAQALRAAGVYDQLAEAGKLVMAQDVRQALVYADRGETDGAFVYKTDALLARGAKILYQVPPHLYDEVTYPMGLTMGGTKNAEAVAFFAFLKSGEAQKVLESYGFVVKR